MNKKGRPRSFLLPLSLTFLCIILVLVGFEIYLRLSRTRVIPAGGATPFTLTADAELLIEHTPRGKRLVPGARVVIKNHRISGRDILMEINSLGFRDDEIIVPRPADEFRILVLGDSITWASYLPREETWVERMEEYLNRDIDGVSVEAINAGVGDIGLAGEIEILKEPGLAVEPDLVLVAFYLNDSRPPGGFPEEIGSRGWLRRHSQLAETVYRKLKLRSWIRERGEDRLAWTTAMNELDWKNDRAEFLELARLARYDWGAAWEPESWEVVREEFDELKDFSERDGFRVAVVFFPTAFQVYAEFSEDQPQRTLEKIASAYGFYYLNILPFLRNYRCREQSVYYDWCHPAPAANDFIGKIIADYLLMKMIILQPAGKR